MSNRVGYVKEYAVFSFKQRKRSKTHSSMAKTKKKNQHSKFEDLSDYYNYKK